MFNSDKDQEDLDYFDGPEIPDTPQEPKKPTPSPDNPDYWEDESEWEHLRPVKRWRIRLLASLGLIILILVITLLIWMFRPYVSDATQYGYVEHIEYRGSVLKTYEGELIPYKEIHDTTRNMGRDFIFSTSDAKVAKTLKRMQLEGKPVRVEYRIYHSRMPWRGETKTIIIEADSVDPNTILPPEFRDN